MNAQNATETRRAADLPPIPVLRPRRASALVAAIAVAAALACCGCTSVLSPIHGIPARRLPPDFLVVPRANLVPTDLNLLRQPPPREYRLAAGDVLGIYIEGVLGDAESAPPVHFPEEASRLPPAIGYPIPVRDDGTLSLPLVGPILVRGMTLREAENAIRQEYTVNRRILQPDNDRMIVTLIKERTTRVIVVREDGESGQTLNIQGGQAQLGPVRKGTGEIINLPAYQNDVLHALAETGGLPGLDAKNEVKIVKAKFADPAAHAESPREFYSGHGDGACYCPPPPPDGPGVIRIPLRVPPGVVPNLRPEDITLEDGDIVYIEAREAEVFYTAGLLPGGQHTLPRDYDVSVLAAMGIAGGGIGQSGGAAAE